MRERLLWIQEGRQDNKNSRKNKTDSNWNKFMLVALMRQLARLPLSWIQATGGMLGWAVYFLSPSYAARLRDNLLLSAIWQDESDYQGILRRNIAESGKAGAELIPIWFRPANEVRKWVKGSTPPSRACLRLPESRTAATLPVAALTRPA